MGYLKASLMHIEGSGKGIPNPLFVIAMEVLNNMLSITKTSKRIQEVEVSKVAGNNVETTYLHYADDMLIFCVAEKEKLLIPRLILVDFEAISKLYISWNKSIFYLINLVIDIDCLSQILGKW